jgi:hypothetical protein
MSLQLVPLTNLPNQSFTANLTVDGKSLSVEVSVRYAEMCGYWVMSISDTYGNLLIDSVPMITGGYPAANLLAQQRYLQIGSWYIINVSNTIPTNIANPYGTGGFGFGPYPGDPGIGDFPDDSNLGTDFQLWVGDTPAS